MGLDAAGTIVEQARGLSDSVEWRVCDAYRLDADLHDFHVVHAHQVLQHLADPVAALARGRMPAARAVSWPRATAITRHSPGTRMIRSSIGGSSSIASPPG